MDGRDLNITITRAKFEELCMDLFKKCLPPVENAARNKALSQNRANEVVKALESRGVVAGSLIPRGFGSEQPVADNATAEGKQQNRRVVINPATSADADKYKADLEDAAKKAAKKKVKKVKRK